MSSTPLFGDFLTLTFTVRFWKEAGINHTTTTSKDVGQFKESESIQDTRGHWLHGHSIPQHVPRLCMCSTSHEFHHLK